MDTGGKRKGGTMNIEERVAKLERENRKLKRLMLVAVLAVGAAAVGAQWAVGPGKTHGQATPGMRRFSLDALG